MANRRLAISSLLSSDSSTPTFVPQPQQLSAPAPAPVPAPALVPKPEPEPVAAPVRYASPPINFSLPATLTRRTPSPTMLDDAPPFKRHRSDPEPHTYAHKHPQGASLSRQYSPAEQSGRAPKVSYNNPGFYSPSGSSPRSPVVTQKARPVQQHAASTGDIHDGLAPVPLATFAETTNTEQRWVESRSGSVAGSASGSGTHSPVTGRPDYQQPRTPVYSSPPLSSSTAIAALSAGAKVVEDVRTSLIEQRSSSRVRRTSADLPPGATRVHHDATSPLPRLAAKSPLPDYTPTRHAGSTIGYPSSSEREPIAALSAGAKVVEDVRTSLIEQRSSSHVRRTSADLPPGATRVHHDATSPLPRLAAKSPLPDYTPTRHAGSTIGYPSSSERERRSPARSTASISPTTAAPPPPPPPHRKSSSFDAARSGHPTNLKSDSPDAHEWLVDHYSQAPAHPSSRVHRGPGMAFAEPGASDRDIAAPPRNYEPVHIQAAAPPKPKPLSPSPTVDEELLSLVDGPSSSTKHRRDEHPDTDMREAAKGPVLDHVEQQPTQHLQPAREDVRVTPARPSQTSDIPADEDVAKPKAKRPRPSGGRKKADGMAAPRQRKKATTAAANARRSLSAMPGSSRMSSPSVATGSTPGPDMNEDVDMDVDVERPSAQDRSPSKREKMKRSKDEDKLYCICKMPYDEDTFMIACDKCDEWYHPACVDLPEHDVELIDQFVCPVCQSVNPTLQTSYKMRCLRGAAGTDEASPDTCRKAARMPLSKYCSDECGLAHVRGRLDEYNTKGGMPEHLWNAVKASRKLEGFTTAEQKTKPAKVFAAEIAEALSGEAKPLTNGHAKTNGVNGHRHDIVNGHSTAQTELQLETLRGMLDRIATERDALLKALDFVRARERLIEVSSGRSERVGECGWDERLLFSDSEWQTWICRAQDGGGAWLLTGGDDDSDGTPGEGGWWCTGKKKCDRHNGWQKLRLAEVEMEKSLKSQLLDTLTSREREIRRCIEDLEPPVLLSNAFSQIGRSRVNGKTSRGGGPRKR
ncbi:hypothetical protein EXIGLDRAFT_744856 [Exidia glandulosa HHB12029]|uniref:PHD-type domain-containing protein n=1 Tax=Exidia glandulosa HHB12029 TaxID=1314781 RepID=A0A165PGA5_EXIGL|nr:hypothetical protein EXIGLDRAFT_744856 [Exidia glandulosa HHB12029]